MVYGQRDGNLLPLDVEELIKSKEKFYDEVILALTKKQKQSHENHNKNREQEPQLKPDETVFVARQGIKSKTKPKFEAVKVKEDKNKTFVDSKERKLHKANVKRITAS